MNAPFRPVRQQVRLAELGDPNEHARIEAFVAAHAEGTPFHRPAWLEAVEQGTGNQALALVAEREGELVAYLPLNCIHSPVFGRMLASTGFAVGGGALLTDGADAEALFASAEELALRLSFPEIELRGGSLPEERDGWRTKRDSHCGFVNPLAADDEAQLLAIPRKQRAEVRKSLERPLEVSVGRGEAERAAHYAVYAESVRNLGTPVFPRRLFDAVLESFGEDADILTVRHDGQPVASVLSLYHKGAVMPYWGGGTWDARRLRANDRMYFELMLHARRRGCSHFDFGRSKTGSGAYGFKRNWGFEPVPLSYAAWTAPGAEPRDADPTSARHALQIAVWRRLPLAVANRLGPLIARGLGLMREILFLSHRIPFPPDRGDKIRSHHVLKRLARIAPVHVATFVDDDADLAEEVELASLAASYCLVRRARPLAVSGLIALALRQPVSLQAFHDAQIADYVSELLETRSISTIYVFSSQMGQYIPEGFTGKVIVDFVDVDSAKFDAYAETSRWPASWIYAREGSMLRDEEARLAARADVSMLVSPAEVQLFESRLTEEERARASVRALPNGIDSEFFHPRMVEAEPRMLEFPYPRLIFTGQMDYKPNVAAAVRVADRILPLIREVMPEATFHVVGRNPSPELLARDDIGGCHVWGRVDDIRCWLKGANLAIVPLEIARGVQNKVFEAMAMALPVVLSPGAATGIGAEDGRHFAIGDSDEELAEAAIALLSSLKLAQARGLSARRFVCEKATWQEALADLPEIAGWPGRAALHAA